MNINQPTVVQNWFTGQLVTASDMNNQTNDLYNKICVISDNVYPCILSGGDVTVSGSTISYTQGLGRCNDQVARYLPNTPLPGFFSWTGGSVVLPSGNGFVVAQITITPNTSGQIIYQFYPGVISTLPNGTGYDPATMVILASYTSGGLINYTNRAYDFGNLESILNAHQRTYVTTNNYQMLATDGNVIVPLSASGVTNLYLPTLVSMGNLNLPLYFNITNINATPFTISTSDSNTVLGTSTYTLNQYSNVTAYFSITDNTWLFK